MEIEELKSPITEMKINLIGLIEWRLQRKKINEFEDRSIGITHAEEQREKNWKN